MKRRPISQAVCLFIRRIRRSKGLSSTEAARRAGIPLGSYSCLERGQYALNVDNLFRILAVLGADIREVWPWECLQPIERVTGRLVERASRSRPGGIGLEDLLEAVCSAYGIADDDLASGCSRTASEARHVAAYILAEDCKHLKLADLARRLKLDPSSIAAKVRRRVGERSESSILLKQRIRRVRELLAEMEPLTKRISRRYSFEDAEAARAFAGFVDGEFLSILSETEGIAHHHLKAVQAKCSQATVHVACTEELSGIFELCWLCFTAAWARKSAPISEGAAPLRQLLRRVARGCRAVGGNWAGARARRKGRACS